MVHKKSKLTGVLAAVMIVCFCILAVFSFIRAPFATDTQVFMAAANQVKYQPDAGLMAVFEAWELKGIGNRLLMYILYRLALLFADYGSIIRFEYAVKAVYAVFAILLTALTAFVAAEDRKGAAAVFALEFSAVFCTYTTCHLQTEMTCVLFSFLIFALLLRGGRGCLVTAGMIGALLFFYKSIFILLFPAAVLGLLLFTEDEEAAKKRAAVSAVSFAGFLLLCAALVRICYPQEFRDMAAAARYQETLFSAGSDVRLSEIADSLQAGWTSAVVGVPFVLAGSCVAAVLLVRFIMDRKWLKVVGLTAMWVLVADIIIVSNRYFLNHYYLLVLPGLISVFCLMKESRMDPAVICTGGAAALCGVFLCGRLQQGPEQASFINYSTVMMAALHIIAIALAAGLLRGKRAVRTAALFLTAAACIFFYLNYSSQLGPKYKNERKLLRQCVDASAGLYPEDFGDEPVLYLDAGKAPFYADAPSCSRYFFNLPLQRWEEGDDWPDQAEEYEKVMRYDGKYIVFDASWFDLDKYPEIREKIDKEYERIPDSGIWIFSPDTKYFDLKKTVGTEVLRANENYCILKRKHA